MRPGLSAPGAKEIGATSPVQRALRWLESFFSGSPVPDIKTDAARSNGALLATHLLQLINGCGFLNGIGHHSAAVALFRSLEDALDCFGAVVLVKDMAEKWANRKLLPSDAAKTWIPLVNEMTARGISLSDYRKNLRSMFNNYSHCSCDLCLWNLYFLPCEKNAATVTGTLELNLPPVTIDSNGHAIDAHLTAHLLEFMVLVRKGYSDELKRIPENVANLDLLEKDIIKIMEQHDEHHCQDVSSPPEVRRVSSVGN